MSRLPLGATTIPSAALLKSQVGGSGPYSFNAQGSGTSVLVDPTIAISAPGQPYDNPTGDASTGLQNAISLMASAAGTSGGVIFLKPGTYHLTKTIKLKGQGVQLVGVRDASGNYPVLTYDNALVDSDYDNRSTIENATTAVLGHQAAAGSDPCTSYPPPAAITGAVGAISVLEHPAVIRILGNEDYGAVQSYSNEGLVGVYIQYSNTGSGGDGASATGVALQAVHESVCRDITVDGACNGLDLGLANSPFFRNISIINIPNNPGNFGANLGPYDILGSNDSNGIKVHALTVIGVSGNTTTTLVEIPGNTQLVGALVQNGLIGIKINGNSATCTLGGKTLGPIPADDVYLRSVEVDNVAEQGVLLDYATQIFMTDITINHAGADAFETTANYYTGLLVTNLTTSYAGLNGIHLYTGLGLTFANAVIHNSNQNLSVTAGGIRIEAPVSSFSLSGAEIGSVSGTTANEKHGVCYLGPGTVATGGPWYTPQTIVASNVNFLSLGGSQYVGTGLAHTNDGDYATLTAAGYFSPPDGDTWAIQTLADDPAIPTGPLSVVRGFNRYDLPATIRDVQWVDLTLINPGLSNAVVALSGGVATFDSLSYYFHYWEGIASTQFGNGGTTCVVLYLPAGHFTFSSSGVPTAWTPISYYQLSKRLLIDQPNVQLVGDGRGVTLINNYFGTTANNDNAVKLYTGSAGSGVFGLTVAYAKAALTPCPAVTSPATAFLPAFLVTGTSKVRLADLGVDYGMGGAISVADTINSEFYSIIMAGLGVNNTQPSVNLAGFAVSATSLGMSQDIRLCQIYGTFTHNIWDPTAGAYITDSHAGSLLPSQIPSLNWIQISGGVQRIRADYNTHIEGKNGLVALAGNTGAVPEHISTVLFATDHSYVYGADIEAAAVNTDMVEGWYSGGGQEGVYFAPAVTDNLRVSSTMTRSQELEGLDFQGGGTVSIVNCAVGNNYNLGAPGTAQTRPAGGIFLGTTGAAALVGGMGGWLGNTQHLHATNNTNAQAFGLMLGLGRTAGYSLYGTDLYGNFNYGGTSTTVGQVGQQTSGTTASVIISN